MQAPDSRADREVVVSRVIEGPRRLVWDAFTTAENLERWWGQPGSKITSKEFDFRPDGVWDAMVEGPYGSFPNHIRWKEIVPPERIVWLYGMGADDPRPVETTMTLTERGPSTEVTLRLLFASKEERDEKVMKYGAAKGAQLALEALAARIEGGAK